MVEILTTVLAWIGSWIATAMATVVAMASYRFFRNVYVDMDDLFAPMDLDWED